jgi:hypothetical protein
MAYNVAVCAIPYVALHYTLYATVYTFYTLFPVMSTSSDWHGPTAYEVQAALEY